MKTRRQFHNRSIGEFIKACHRAAAIAPEMRVFIRVLIRHCVETPYTVISGNAMRELVGNQPLEDAVNRNAIDRKRAPHALLDLVVCQRSGRV